MSLSPLLHWVVRDSISRNLAVCAVLTACWMLVDEILAVLDERKQPL